MVKGKPLIQFVPDAIPDSDTRITCPCGSDRFRLELKVRLSGAMVTRIARCVQCEHSEPID